MDFLILRPLPPKTGYHFFEGGGGGGGQKFLLNRLQAVGTHGAGNTASGPMVTRPMPKCAGVGSNRDLPTFSAAAGGGAKVGRLGSEPPTTRMLAGCVTTRPLLGLWRMASLLLGAASATDKKPKLCVSV